MKKTTTNKLVMLLALGLLASCGKNKDSGSGDKPADQPKAVDGDKPSTGSGPFAEFGDNDAILKKWQGSWVLESTMLGHYEAWEVKGNKITVFDGKAESTKEIEIQAPCQAKIVAKSGSGTSGTTAVFVFEGDTLHTGLGSAGVKKGDKILACGSGEIFVWDGKTCTAYEDHFGKMETKPTECKLDGSTFTAKRPGFDMESTFAVTGDILMNDQMTGNKVEKATSFEDAKAKLAARK